MLRPAYQVMHGNEESFGGVGAAALQDPRIASICTLSSMRSLPCRNENAAQVLLCHLQSRLEFARPIGSRRFATFRDLQPPTRRDRRPCASCRQSAIQADGRTDLGGVRNEQLARREPGSRCGQEGVGAAQALLVPAVILTALTNSRHPPAARTSKCTPPETGQSDKNGGPSPGSATAWY